MGNLSPLAAVPSLTRGKTDCESDGGRAVFLRCWRLSGLPCGVSVIGGHGRFLDLLDQAMIPLDLRLHGTGIMVDRELDWGNGLLQDGRGSGYPHSDAALRVPVRRTRKNSDDFYDVYGHVT
jgi:hypothetical protein